MQVVAVINYKGGVGKTTLCGSVAQALALCGYRVLALDNDAQHSLSTLLGAGVCAPSIRDVYRAAPADAAQVLLRAIRRSTVENLHVISADRALSVSEVADQLFLRTTLERARAASHYDYVLIDNAPGLELLQLCAVHACDMLLVPVEMKQFALDAAMELRRSLEVHFGMSMPPLRIVANCLRETMHDRSFLHALNMLFSGQVASTAIPQDPLFDELITRRQILFVDRVTSRAAAYYLKLVHELFNLNEEDLWQQMTGKPRPPAAARRTGRKTPERPAAPRKTRRR